MMGLVNNIHANIKSILPLNLLHINSLLCDRPRDVQHRLKQKEQSHGLVGNMVQTGPGRQGGERNYSERAVRLSMTTAAGAVSGMRTIAEDYSRWRLL